LESTVNLLNYTIDLFRGEAEAKGVRIDNIKLVDGPTIKIECSEQHIKQLFFNIIHNAVKYSFEGSEDNIRFISVLCKGYQNSIRIQISNYGVGILPEELEKGLLFSQGYRGLLAGDRCRIGSGLGLWIAKRTIDDHHGKIKIESQKMSLEGDGPYKTTVTIDLPIWQPLNDMPDGFLRED
jgi:signal transduction histidine kinase